MPGASGAISVKHLATQTKADGWTIGILSETSAADVIESKVLSAFEILRQPRAAPAGRAVQRPSGITDG